MAIIYRDEIEKIAEEFGINGDLSDIEEQLLKEIYRLRQSESNYKDFIHYHNKNYHCVKITK